MNTLAFILAGVLILLVIMAKIPGLEYLVKPVIDLLFSLIKVLSENAFSWVIWLFKALMASHVELFKNLLMKAEDIDPSHSMRNMDK